MINRLVNNYGPVTEEQLSSFERTAGVALPPRYKSFLLETNGGRPVRKQFRVPEWPGKFSVMQGFFPVSSGTEYSVSFWIKELEDRLPQGMIPVGVDPGGNFICIDSQPPYADRVYYWDSSPDWDLPPEGPTMFEVAKDIQEFIDSMTEEKPID